MRNKEILSKIEAQTHENKGLIRPCNVFLQINYIIKTAGIQWK